MMTVNEHIRRHLLRDIEGGSLEELQESEWSPSFESMMRNRLIIGAMRYGRLSMPGKKDWDRIGSIKTRVDAYIKTGNLEHLVDIANLCLCEFVEGRHPKRHFHSTDDGVHTEENEK